MTTLLLLRLYLFVGAVYGLSVVATAEATHPSEVAALPLQLRLRIYLAVLALGLLAWPVAPVMDHRGGS